MAIPFSRHADLINPDTDRSPSQSLWADCPWITEQSDPALGTCLYDDFTQYTVVPGTQTTELPVGDKYKVYNTGAGTLIPVNAVPTTVIPGGYVRCLCDTDGDAGSIAAQLGNFALNTKPLWFEARIAVTSILTNMAQVMVGLGEVGVWALSATVPLGNADAGCTTGAAIGLRTKEDGLGILCSSYQDRSATFVDVQTTSVALAALTFKKLGMKYDPSDLVNTITFYIDGVKQANVISAATLAACTYLDVGGLGPFMAVFADSAGTADYVYLDWWRVFQSA